VNDDGQLCGSFTDADLINHIVVATPRKGVKSH
jgi:hypothetical protein